MASLVARHPLVDGTPTEGAAQVPPAGMDALHSGPALGPGGTLEDDPRAAVLEKGADPAGIVEELTIIHDAITHPAMSPAMRTR
jgi:hypothetical protein